MLLEDCIRFDEERFGVERGDKCHTGDRDYDRYDTSAYDFHEPTQSRLDRSYRGPGDDDYFDFVARGPDGGRVYVGCCRRITFGPKGYDYVD